MENAIEKMFQQAADWQIDDLDFYMDFLESGYTLSDLEYNTGRYLYSKRFMLDHGLLEEDLDTDWKTSKYNPHTRVREIEAGLYEIIAAVPISEDKYVLTRPMTIDLMEKLDENGMYGDEINGLLESEYRETYTFYKDNPVMDEKNQVIAELLYFSTVRLTHISADTESEVDEFLDMYIEGNYSFDDVEKILLYQNSIKSETDIFLENNRKFEENCICFLTEAIKTAHIDKILMRKDCTEESIYKLVPERNMRNPLSGEFYLALYRIKKDGEPHSSPIKRYRVKAENVFDTITEIKREYVEAQILSAHYPKK